MLDSRGLERTRQLAAEQAAIARQSLEVLPPSVYRQALADMTDYVLERLY